MQLVNELKQIVETLEVEMLKATAGNKAAGKRARKICQNIKVKLGGIREQALKIVKGEAA